VGVPVHIYEISILSRNNVYIIVVMEGAEANVHGVRCGPRLHKPFYVINKPIKT
jgi:hypothetical protein